LGTLKPKKRAKGNIKVIDPQPIWEVTVQRENKSPTKLYMTTDKADAYFKAGHEIRLITTAGKLHQQKE